MEGNNLRMVQRSPELESLERDRLSSGSMKGRS